MLFSGDWFAKHDGEDDVRHGDIHSRGGENQRIHGTRRRGLTIVSSG